MLLHALKLITNELNEYLNSIVENEDDVVVLGNIASIDSKGYTPKVSNSIVLSLVNIEEESTLKNIPALERNPMTGVPEYKNPPVFLNLYLLFSINSNKYENALTYLSRVITFFQGKHVFTHYNTPNTVPVTPGMENDFMQNFKLILEMHKLTFEQLNHLWGMLGGKQLPGVMYKLRIIPLERKGKITPGTTITEVQIDTSDI